VHEKNLFSKSCRGGSRCIAALRMTYDYDYDYEYGNRDWGYPMSTVDQSIGGT